MSLQHLTLTNFKNYQSLDVDFSARINCITGDNGEGKTNILDAIYYLSFCKSFFTGLDAQNIRHGEQFFIVEGNYDIDGQAETIYCGFEPGKRKRFKRNKKEYERFADHIGLIPLVMVSPYDINLIIGGSEERRKFIDGIISQFDREYLLEYQKYTKILAQRNHLLKETPQTWQIDEDMLQIYDDQLAESGQFIYQRRKDFVGNIEPVFQRYFETISQGKERVSLIYRTTLDEKPLDQQLRDNRSIDLATRYTNFGVHKDDLELAMGDIPIKRIGSQGQQKTYLVAMKLAQFEYIGNLCGQKPILLLDDIFDKLDQSRVEQIVNLVAQNNFGQIFITDTNADRINGILTKVGGEHRHFNLENNILTLL
ncbi:MAG: DNA replication/repair protein RecF [Salinivirgaceae bacterium]|nr:DNA replication/repair protein RecF [Salinivirgaceae bacterium]